MIGLHQALVEHSLETAKQMLDQTNEFHPFGAFLGKNGTVHPLGVEVDKKNIPSNGDLIQQLNDLAKTENIEHYSLCYEVSIQLVASRNPTDAICVEIKVKDVPKFYLPFSKSGETFVYDEVFAVE
jgi:hypothetical protein